MSSSIKHASPRDLSDIQEFPKATLMDVVRVVKDMNSAQNSWSKETLEERASRTRKLLVTFQNLLNQSRDKIANTVARDIGMPIRHAKARSIPAAIEIIQQTSKVHETAETFPASGHAAVLLGWTDPLLGFCRRVPQLIASGNGVCVKPSSRAPRTVALISEMFSSAMSEVGVPLGLLAVLHGPGRGEDEVGESLLRHPGFKSIHWIGSTDRAEVAQAIALEHGKRFYFAGSGRNPLVLFQGYDESTFEKILDDLTDSITDPHGYGPYRPSRLFVQESIYKSVLEKLALRFSNLRAGDPLEEATDVGPLPRSEAERFTMQTGLALSETGHLVTGGERNSDFAAPTLIRDLTNCSTLQSEELAGPWATIASFKYQHEALKYANTSPLGLAAYVLHPDPAKAKSVAHKLEASRIFFGARPPWPAALIERSAPAKHSANSDDGVQAIFASGQWRATLFS